MRDTAMTQRQGDALAPRQETWFTPLVDIFESGDEFVFQADLPGVKAGDVEILFENGTLTMQGKVQPRQPETQDFLWREYSVGAFYRQFNLGAEVAPDRIKAELKNGVLEVRVPKAESAKTRHIEIKPA